MNIAVFHNAVSLDDSPEDQDTLAQATAIAEALCRLGHEPVTVPCTLDLAAARQTLLDLAPDLVVNLVESLGGCDSLAHLASALLDSLRLPYTGSPTEALFATNHKLIAKRTMRQAGLPTPRWLAVPVGSSCREEPAHLFFAGVGMAQTSTSEDNAPFLTAHNMEPPCIIKSVWEHGSRGLDDENVVCHGDTALIRQRVQEFIARTGRPHFAEQFIEGREFNVPMLDSPDGPQVLPPGEMDFSTFPEGKPRIINHRAKWHEDSFEYNNTPRSFDHHSRDERLVEQLKQLSLDCWRVFDLRGYVRVDFRVDRAGQPWILEVNANPCLSPEAGYAAALDEAGVSYDDAVRRIVESAVVGRESVLELRT